MADDLVRGSTSAGMCESGATVVDTSRHTHMQLRGTSSVLKHSLLYSARAIQVVKVIMNLQNLKYSLRMYVVTNEYLV